MLKVISRAKAVRKYGIGILRVGFAVAVPKRF
jgi:hypothetical protein